MKVVAFLPLRKSSKSITGKNIKLFCDKPLTYWVLKELQKSNVDKIIVATDSKKIKQTVYAFNFSKVFVYDRKLENAKDESTSESVMLEYINNSNLKNKDIFLLAQATSPFTLAKNFNDGLDLIKDYDSVLSCCVFKRFLWQNDGLASNYDPYNRPRRQDFGGNLIENGAFYISTVKGIKESKNRISGKIGICEMPEYTSFEIDELHDWIVAEELMRFHLKRIEK